MQIVAGTHISLKHALTRVAPTAAAALALGLALPGPARASEEGLAAEAPASGIEEGGRAAERAAERAARRAERLAAREAARSERLQQREAARSERRRRRQAARGERAEAHEAGGSDRGGRRTSSRGVGGCQLGLAATPERVSVGETAALSGKLTCAGDEATAGGREIAVFVRSRSAGKSRLATVTTEPDGSFALSSEPLQVSSAFSARLAGARPARAVVEVAPDITLVAPEPQASLSAASPTAHQRPHPRATFTGTVTPTTVGARVALQVSATGGPWHPVAWGRVDASGGYSIAHSFKLVGQLDVRAVVHAGPNDAPAISEALSYDVSPTQNPLLTIQLSTDPTAYGQPVQISGAAAEAGQSVTLLGRSRGGSFAPLAQATTDPGGGYSFTETPLQSTEYEVTDATSSSATLNACVSFALTAEPEPETATVGEPVQLGETVAPGEAGQVVYLERRYASGEAFRVVAVGKLDASSRVRIDYTFARSGTSVMRFRVPANGKLLATAGEPFSVAVSP